MELLHFSHFHHVSLVQWTKCLLLTTGLAVCTPGVQPTLWNWDYLLRCVATSVFFHSKLLVVIVLFASIFFNAKSQNYVNNPKNPPRGVIGWAIVDTATGYTNKTFSALPRVPAQFAGTHGWVCWISVSMLCGKCPSITVGSFPITCLKLFIVKLKPGIATLALSKRY